MDKNFERAMVLAEEFHSLDNQGREVEAAQVERTIGELVGRWVDGKFALPEAIRRVMNRAVRS